MNNELLSIFVLSIPEAILNLVLCMSFLNRKFSLGQFLAYCVIMGGYFYFLVPLISVHLYYIISYAVINIILLKLIFGATIFDSLVAYSISCAIYFAIENVFIQIEFKLLGLNPEEFVRMSLHKIGSFYVLAIIICLIILFIRKKKIVIANTGSVDTNYD